MTELENYIHTHFKVDYDDLETISSFFTPLEIKKGDYFLHMGRYSNRLGFVQSGIFTIL
jgi:CRP/FNR family transcriptional regulator, anaerobic regulatory protein